MSDDLLTEDATPQESSELRPQEKPTTEEVREAVDKTAESVDTAEPTGDLLSGDGGSSEGVPDEYTFETPDGVTVNQDQLSQFNEAAKAAGITQAQYTNLVEFELQRTEAANTAAVEAWQGQVKGWQEEARADKTFGGEAFADTMQNARSALKQFGDDGLRSLLADPTPENPQGLGLRHHPAILRALSRIGKSLSDPSLIEGDAAPQDAGALKRLYPSMFKETA